MIKLRRFRDPAAADSDQGHCEMCAEPVAWQHGHMVDLETRALLCVCRSCRLLFIRPGAALGRFRAVPDRYLHLPAFRLRAADWEELQIPVRMAFFLHNSALGRTVAFYPSAAGAAECELPLTAWDRVLASNPRLAEVRPDVEAVLIDQNPGGFGCYVVPIDACYELVALFRLHWRGLTGGPKAWDRIEDYFKTLRRRSDEAALRGIGDLD
ncbi:MAG: hypothetical protein JWO67_1373 [Streptosporangiaceae bacterium]|jgi:hypothetical protein|nr:hypothetical protein [Streptosporangiaceae bacterium]